MKICFIVVYFGQLPDYFQIFLDSCKPNTGFDWIVVTDDQTPYRYPENVRPIYMEFSQCVEFIRSKFDFPVALGHPKKLCDYKVAYGYIFADYLRDYDWWGHCDLDQIFGRLDPFITEDMLNRFDKIGSLGHLTLYRNTPENNRMFQQPLRGEFLYRKVFSMEDGCAFDEWLPGNINEIYLEHCRPVELDNYGADINPYRTDLVPLVFNITTRKYRMAEEKYSIFQWDGGRIHRLVLKNNQIDRLEYPYIHLQKRKMTDKRADPQTSYYIIHNAFVNGNCDTETLIRKERKWKWLNYQFFKVKWSSLKSRLLTGNWKFNSVFRLSTEEAEL